ncbi:hypothetical protein [Embleya sp. NPDC020630]|uniref:hypothetical protein n=1 Tax=Embleya sp. NPDC020630 TaxID=3363979 RepID=UPI0037BAFE8C
MNTDDRDAQAASEQRAAMLRRVAQDPEAFARYMADVQRTLLGIGASLERLQRETRVHCRGAHVEGDRWYQARLRARPVESALREVLKHVHGLTDGLEKSVHKRRAHAEEMEALPRRRRERELARERKRNPALRSAPRVEENGEDDIPGGRPGYGVPTSVYDLRRGRGKSA